MRPNSANFDPSLGRLGFDLGRIWAAPGCETMFFSGACVERGSVLGRGLQFSQGGRAPLGTHTHTCIGVWNVRAASPQPMAPRRWRVAPRRRRSCDAIRWSPCSHSRAQGDEASAGRRQKEGRRGRGVEAPGRRARVAATPPRCAQRASPGTRDPGTRDAAQVPDKIRWPTAINMIAFRATSSPIRAAVLAIGQLWHRIGPSSITFGQI